MHKLADLMMHVLLYKCSASIVGMHLDNHVQRIHFQSVVVLVDEQLSFLR